jgi:pimeloyl-ACP methyl ester carboxylesterase
MAQWWAAQGVAALAYDKRGVGQSTGDFQTVPFQDLHLDGLAGVAWLKTRREIDASRIGVWGLSQGGWLGPLAAIRSPDIHFVVAVSGPGVSPGEQMIFYYANQLRARGVPEADIERVTALRRRAWTAAFTGHDLVGARAEVSAERATMKDANVKEQLGGLVRVLSPPRSIWIAEEMNYDPIETLRHLTVPALFLFGGDDTLVPVPASIDAIQRVLAETHHPDFQIKLIPGADHGMYVTDADGSHHLSAEYLSDMASWVRTRVAR